MARGKRSDVALYEGIASLPGVADSGWGPGFGMPMGGPSGPEAPHQSLWQMIDDRMRGRWPYALGIGAALAVVLGVIGYLSAEPMFISTGTIEIASEAKPILHRLEDQGIPNYDRFVATQVEYIKSSTVIARALTNLRVQQLHITKGMLRDGLHVERDPRSQLIYVSFESEDAPVAEASVNAVLDSYFQEYGQTANQQIDNILNELDSKAKELDRRRASLDRDIGEITKRYNATDLNAVQKANFDQMTWLRTQINVGRRELGHLKPTTQPGAAEGGVPVPTAAALATLEPRLNQLQDNLDREEYAFNLVRGQFRPTSNQYISAAQKHQVAKEAYDRLYEVTLDAWRKMDPAVRASKGLSQVVTAEDIAQFEKDYATYEQHQGELVRDISLFDDLKYQQNNVQKEIERIRDRMNAIELERKPLTDTIKVSQKGALPDRPEKDQRKTRLLMGIIAGMGGSLGFFFLLGAIDRRAYGASQLGLGGNLPPCLGVLPDLGASLTDPETSDVASHCVHQIRNQIEAVRDPVGGYVLAVSSPFQGDGKTSIVMALGWSYAAAGYNTLLIDCDMIGRSLTRQLGLTGREGLKEALVARKLNGSINRLPWVNLSAVAVGVDARFGPENMRRVDLERLVDQVRDQYDIILVDTGPLLGSLESTPVTAVADGVVLSVRRGRSRGKLEDCVARLKLVGTTCVGVILNCAMRSDCNRYVSEASLAAAEEERVGRGALPAASGRPVTPGERNALVRAVQSTTRQRGVEPGADADGEADDPSNATDHGESHSTQKQS